MPLMLIAWSVSVNWNSTEGLLLGVGVIIVFASLPLSSLPKIGTVYYRSYFPAMLEAEGLPIPEGVHPPTMMGRIWYWLRALIGYGVVSLFVLVYAPYYLGILAILPVVAILMFYIYGYLRYRIRRNGARPSNLGSATNK